MNPIFCLPKIKVKSWRLNFSEQDLIEYSSRKPSSFFWKSFPNPAVILIPYIFDWYKQ